FLFFFQAEDGIRDFHVTGVQTCALRSVHLGVAERSLDPPDRLGTTPEPTPAVASLTITRLGFQKPRPNEPVAKALVGRLDRSRRPRRAQGPMSVSAAVARSGALRGCNPLQVPNDRRYRRVRARSLACLRPDWSKASAATAPRRLRIRSGQ